MKQPRSMVLGRGSHSGVSPLPLITPITFYLLVMGVIGNMQSFAEIHVMLSNGGTEYSGATIVYFLWQKAFQNYEMGFACAVAWILGSIIFILTLLQFKTMPPLGI